MVKVFGSTLPGKPVMGVDGSVVGRLVNVLVDKKTGVLTEFVVKPDPSMDIHGMRMEGDYLLVPATAVRSIRDYIVVDKQRLARGSSMVEEL
ncbi:MAG: PRC-barrel domain-containing protein [Methermicoccaceae archaeon]